MLWMLYSLFVQNFHFALSKLFWKKVSDERIDYYYSYIIIFSIFPLITFLFLYPFSVNLRLLLSVNVTSLPKTVGQNYLDASWTSGSMTYLNNQSGWCLTTLTWQKTTRCQINDVHIFSRVLESWSKILQECTIYI